MSFKFTNTEKEVKLVKMSQLAKFKDWYEDADIYQ